MRDAEAQVNMNELRQRIADLNRAWELHMSTCKNIRENNNSNDSNLNNDTYDLIAHELLSLKMREAQIDCDNKLLSRQLMDVETQKQILHNQIKRQDDEVQRIRLELEESRLRESQLSTQLNNIKRQMHDEELKVNKKTTNVLCFLSFVRFCNKILFSKKKILCCYVFAKLKVPKQFVIYVKK